MPTNHWVFQTNPKVFDLAAALKNEALRTFTVTAHKNKIQKGDKIILWQTGKESGCYALCEALSEPQPMPPSPSELPFFLDKNFVENHEIRLLLRVEFNLWNRPITSEMLYDKAFDGFNIGLPGTNFQATANQYNTLCSLIETYDLVYETLPPYETCKHERKPQNLILYGPPGTGKTYQTLLHALAVIEGKSLLEVEIENRHHRPTLKERYDDYRTSGQIEFITFHPAFAYEDFVEGIRPKEADQKVYYEIENGVFKRICERATKALQTHLLSEKIPPLTPKTLRYAPKFVLIIDEINRGNIAHIFGELITLLERDKRTGMPEALSARLPYSKASFGVPPNLFLLATMNTADRSLETLDNALRRRFFFEEIPPQPALLPSLGEINLAQMLDAMNRRLEILLDKDHRIGHAYFLQLQTLEDLQIVFANQILPLLQEYFYGDWGKIGLTLGDAFVKRKKKNNENLFSSFFYDFKEDFEIQDRYELTPVSDWDVTAFLSIYRST